MFSPRFPADGHYPVDIHNAGGITALMGQLAEQGLLHTDAMTVSAQTVADNVAASKVLNSTVIRPVDNAYSAKGGLQILYGNLAPDGSILQKRRCCA